MDFRFSCYFSHFPDCSISRNCLSGEKSQKTKRFENQDEIWVFVQRISIEIFLLVFYEFLIFLFFFSVGGS